MDMRYGEALCLCRLIVYFSLEIFSHSSNLCFKSFHAPVRETGIQNPCCFSVTHIS